MQRHPSADAARHDAIRRVFDLPWRDILEVYRTIGSYIEVGGTQETKLSKQLRERVEAVEALEAVAVHLGLAHGAPLRVADFDAAARDLGLSLSSAKVIRRWESWRVAVAALWRQSIRRRPSKGLSVAPPAAGAAPVRTIRGRARVVEDEAGVSPSSGLRRLCPVAKRSAP